jgi:hypothetical protein
VRPLDPRLLGRAQAARRLLGAVTSSQSFSMSIRENVRLGRPQACDVTHRPERLDLVDGAVVLGGVAGA